MYVLSEHHIALSPVVDAPSRAGRRTLAFTKYSCFVLFVCLFFVLPPPQVVT